MKAIASCTCYLKMKPTPQVWHEKQQLQSRNSFTQEGLERRQAPGQMLCTGGPFHSPEIHPHFPVLQDGSEGQGHSGFNRAGITIMVTPGTCQKQTLHVFS